MQNEVLEILFEDKNLIAVNKPAGLLVHRTYLDPHETRFAIQILRNQIGSWVYPIHRLDKGTSGVLLFSKNQEYASIMGEIVLRREFQKVYLAIVRGFTPDVMRINYPVPQGRNEERKPAATAFYSLARTELEHEVGIYSTARYSLLKLIPETGRRHQIRRHLKHIFYPIVGDRRYGDRAHNLFYREILGLPQMFLHAYELKFKHPISSKTIHIKAPMPEHWNTALRNFNNIKEGVPC